MDSESISGESYATTIISDPGPETPPEVDSDLEYEIVYHQYTNDEAQTNASDTHSDQDSTFDNCATSIHTSVKSFVTKYPYKHGRRYHAFKAGSYLIPNDEREQERMHIIHHVWQTMLGGRLSSNAVTHGLGLSTGYDYSANAGHRVLDVGTGTGSWAIDWADEYSGTGAVVVGNDLSPIQPRWIPPNCSFEIDDFEEPWSYSSDEAFDFIHGRDLAGSVESWPAFLSNAYTHLKPGGWVEIKQNAFGSCSDVDPTLELSPTLRDGQKLLQEACARTGKRIEIVDNLEHWMRNTGFLDVQREIIEVPIGTWPTNGLMKAVGTMHLQNSVEEIESYGLGLFTQMLGWSLEETQFFVRKMQEEVKKDEMKFYGRFHIVCGRKGYD